MKSPTAYKSVQDVEDGAIVLMVAQMDINNSSEKRDLHAVTYKKRQLSLQVSHFDARQLAQFKTVVHVVAV